MSEPVNAPTPALPDRQCGRCRRHFPADPTLHPATLAEWWACPPCRLALFGPPAAAGNASTPR